MRSKPGVDGQEEVTALELAEGFRPLDDRDVDEVLEAMPPGAPGRIGKINKSKLRARLNRTLLSCRNRYQARPPHQRIKQLRIAKDAIERATKALGQGGGWLHAAIAREIRDIPEAERQQTGCVEDLGEAMNGMRIISHLLSRCETKQRKRRDHKSRRRQPDLERYFLVTQLADVYHRTFAKCPKGSRDGPWCTFLAEVLSRCEGQPLGNEGAQSLWLLARAAAVERGWIGRDALNILLGQRRGATQAGRRMTIKTERLP